MQTSSIQTHPSFGQKLISIEGVIGVGKTSLVRLLGAKWGVSTHFEAFEENPFLTGGFYEDPEALAFNTEVFFLLSRFRQWRTFQISKGLKLVDYLFDKSRIFAQKTLTTEDWSAFDTTYQQLRPTLQKPDLVIYLKADQDTLLRRIYFRDRQFERNISPRYIEDLNQRYDKFFDSYEDAPVLTVDVSELDFVGRSADFERLANVIEQRLSGNIQLSLIRNRLKESHV